MANLERVQSSKDGFSIDDNIYFLSTSSSISPKSVYESSLRGALLFQKPVSSSLSAKMWFRYGEDTGSWAQVGMMEVSASAPTKPSTEYLWQRPTDGNTFYYDNTNGRNKWLSVKDYVFSAGRSLNSASNQYMRRDDAVPMNSSPIVLKDKMTLYALTVMHRNASTWTLQIENQASVVFSQSISAQKSVITTTLNTDFNQNDRVKFYINGTADNAVVTTYFKVRQ
jgi:hypothetical protein